MRNMKLEISLSNVEASMMPLLLATTKINDDEDLDNFEFVKYDQKTKTFTFKAKAKIHKERKVLH